MEQNSPTDADLVAGTLAGSREAFGQLYDRYARTIRAVVAGVSADWSAADDMAQECFMRAYLKLGSLRDHQQFGAWIVGIARHVVRERRRSLRRDRHEFRDPRPWEIESVVETDAAVRERDQMELVMQKLAVLNEPERLAIHAFFLQGQDARKSAELLGLSRSGFYALVQRAVARLAVQLHPCDVKERTKR